MVKLEISDDTFAILISGLYCSYHNIDAYAIPEPLWMILSEKVIPYFKEWDYDKLSFENWIKENILIYPKLAMSDDEIESCKENDIYFEMDNGNVLLIVSVEMP